MLRRPGELVLVYVKDAPSFYGRIEKIEPDIKPGWYGVTFLFLGIPPRTVVWILREEYIDGTPFTMGGVPIRIEVVPPYQEQAQETKGEARAESRPETAPQKEGSTHKGPKVIQLKPRK